jgi:hypothetical protein
VTIPSPSRPRTSSHDVRSRVIIAAASVAVAFAEQLTGGRSSELSLVDQSRGITRSIAWTMEPASVSRLAGDDPVCAGEG